jgi:hypothetical protein
MRRCKRKAIRVLGQRERRIEILVEKSVCSHLYDGLGMQDEVEQ